MPWQDAVEETEDGCALLLEATPGSRRAVFPDGFNAWRGRIGIAVRAAAQDGKANKEVVAAVAGFFGVPASSVSLASGGADRRKRVVVTGVGADAARARLEAHL